MTTTTELVIGLDSSTQSTKAIAWNRQGDAICEGRADIPMQNPGFERYEQAPEDWWSACCIALRECVSLLPENCTVVGLSISNQRETIGFVSNDGATLAPAIVWLDERARDYVKIFCDQFGADRVHQITGRPPDLTPCLYRIAWMKDHEPELYARKPIFVDVQCYLSRQLCGGRWRTGWTSADPMGLLDMEKKQWSEPILDALELSVDQFPELVPPGETLGNISEAAAALTGLPENLPVFAAGGDGQCAGLGTNCTTPDRAYINLGTAVVSGIWSADYRISTSWRTEIAAQGNGYILENCLRSGAHLLNWFVDMFNTSDLEHSGDVFVELEKEAMQLPIGSEGLLIQPYWSGVMDPYWDNSARGVITGIGAAHTRAHIYRAILEGITLDQVMSTQDMERDANQHISHYLAIGGGAKSKLWRQMLADASGKEVKISPTVEASALGAGMTAAFGAGWFESIEQAADSMSRVSETITPRAETKAAYDELLSIYRELYHSGASINQRLVALAAAQKN